MKLPLVPVACFASFILAAACAGAADGSGPENEGTGRATDQLSIIAPINPIAPIAPAAPAPTFASFFGKPVIVPGQQSADCAVGEVRLFAGPMPTNFVPADGRLLSIEQNTAVFAELLTQYGGDGRTTFAVPNLTALTPNGLGYGMCIYGTFTGNRTPQP